MGRGNLRQNNNMTPAECQAGLNNDALCLVPEAQRSYDAVVRPNAILPIPRYFLEHWLPLLGTSRSWLALAFRQVAFVSRSNGNEVPVQTTLRQLGRWCGLTHVRVHQVLKDPDLLTWFVRNPQGSLSEHRGARSQPDTYLVRADIPLTPEDQARLSLWLQKRKPLDEQDWIATLQEAVQARKLSLPPNHPLPSRSLTIQALVQKLRGIDLPLPPSLDEACTELHARWIQPDRVTLVTHYFIRQWLPDLSPGLGWLIVTLRSRAYQQDKAPLGHVWISGGWTQLAKELSVSRKSITRWSQSPIAGLFFARQSDSHDPIDRSNQLIAIRLSEPIHPKDSQRYQTLLAGQNSTNNETLAGQDLTNPFMMQGQNLTNPLPAPSQNLTTPAHSSTEHGRNLTSTGQNLTAAGHSLTSPATEINKPETELNINGTEFTALKHLKTDSNTQNKLFQDYPPPEIQIQQKQVVAPISVQEFAMLLQQSGLPAYLREEILQASPDQHCVYLAWLLFAFTTKSIHSPALFAATRYREEVPPNAFLALLRNPFLQIMDWLAGRDEPLDASLAPVVADLRRGGAYQKLLNLGLNQEQEDPLKPARDLSVAKEEEHHRNSPHLQIYPMVRDAWKFTRAELQKTLARADFDTWVSNVEVIEVRGATIILGAANEYARAWLDANLTDAAERFLTDHMGFSMQVQFMVMDDVSQQLAGER